MSRRTVAATATGAAEPHDGATGHDADGGAGWAALWAQCLQVVAGRPPRPAGPGQPRLAWARAAGWTIDGPRDPSVASLFALYKPLLDCRPGDGGAVRPWVVGQLGQSLDGFIATPAGDSRHLNGAANLRHLHRLRALSDAVLVGAGTVAADNPRLTTRLVPGRHPVRVVLDPRAMLPPDRVLFVDGAAPTLWLHDAALPPAAPPTCEAVAVPGLAAPDGSADLRAALAALRARGLAVVFVEGGGVTISRALAQGVLDRLHVAVAPLLIGRGRAGLQGPARASLAECRRPKARVVPMGDDVLWDLDLRGSG